MPPAAFSPLGRAHVLLLRSAHPRIGGPSLREASRRTGRVLSARQGILCEHSQFPGLHLGPHGF
jgi:hypothetical protein